MTVSRATASTSARALARTLTPLALSAILLVTLTGTSCGTTPFVKSFPAETRKQMEQVVDAKVDAYHLPGIVVGVWVPGRGTWIIARGKADLETGKKLKSTMKFRITGTTKPFTSTLLAMLDDEGKLSLDDKLSMYFPEVPGSKNISIRRLLNHTSGLFDYEEDDTFDRTVRTKPLTGWTPEQLVGIGISHPPYFSPGAGFHYSNTNYILAGLIAEKVTGNTAVREMNKRMFNELGLQDTSLPDGPDIVGDYSHGYYNDFSSGALVDITNTDQSSYWTAGAIISSLEDLHVWSKALADGQLLSSKGHDEQMTFVTVPGGEAHGEMYGLGVSDLKGWLGHDGANYGYNSAMYHLPSKDATIVVLANKFPPALKEPVAYAREIFGDLANIIFPGTGFPNE